MLHKKIIVINLILFITVVFVCLFTIYQFPLFDLNNFKLNAAIAEEEEEIDEEPPVISNINISEITATSTKITWKTDENADSLINYSINKNYGISRDSAMENTHEILLDDLLPEKLYYFRIISSDSIGNQSISNDYSFTTLQEQVSELPGEENKPTDNEEYKQSELVDKTLEMLEKITDEESLSLIESAIKNIAEESASAPTVRGNSANVETGTDYAIIRWTTDKDSNSMASISEEKDYDINNPDIYLWKMGEPDEMVKQHEVYVAGLKPATTYHYIVSSKSILGLEGRSEDSTFRTKSILPEIYNINLVKIEEESVTIAWSTNVPCSAIIEYTDLNTNEARLEGNSTLATSHLIKLNNLKFDTYYSAIISVENEQGEKTVSGPITFTTAKDEFAPIISKVNTESTLYPGSENRTQTVISWQTDEVSVCQFFYQQGLASSKEEASSFPKEEDFISKHIQVVNAFQSSSVYKFWISCEDKAANLTRSEDFTMLTPAQEQSIIDLIIKNFEGTFGWLNKKQ